MNVHAFRSDDLATACRTVVEQEEEQRRKTAARDARRARWADREQRFTLWWQYEYGAAATLKLVIAFFVFFYVVGVFAVFMTKRDATTSATNKLACYRACKIHKPVVAVGPIDSNGDPRVCLCYRKDGTPAVLLPEQRFEELRKP